MDQDIKKRSKPLKDESPLKLFEHFKTEQEWAEHLHQVEQAQHDGAPF